ncbi:hypothetical protein DBV15_03625 [Temnothorax longispinosus]|uniref:Uncharacterized protein n=1 Tax=Temnothorax longispinosus TaxID=300112 RepID=A0A4S2KQ48_9HYME|nr:hypothetical protein DBV15_03625 [Temnothorax longispinosus]
MAGAGGSSSWPALRFPGALAVRAVMPRKLYDTPPCIVLTRGNQDTCLGREDTARRLALDEKEVTQGRRSETERDQIWISGLGWHVIRRGRRVVETVDLRRQIPSRRNSAGTSPGQIRQEQQPNSGRAAEIVYGSSQVGEI